MSGTNGIDDLRRTLEEHAGGPDEQLTRRAGAVRGRARVVRRRRLGAAAVAAVAVLGVSAVVLGSGGDDLPVARTLAGVAAPSTMRSLGYTYDYAEGAEGTRTVGLDLAESDQPRLVTWATSGSDDTVTVDLPADDPVVWDGADFTRWTIVPAGVAGTVEASVDSGEVALASYTLSARADGITEHGVTFRDAVAGQTLVAAGFGEPGAATAEVAGSARGSSTGVHYFCAGAPEGAWVRVVVDGKDASGSDCSTDAPPVDVAGNNTSRPTSPGDPVTATVTVTDGEDGPVLPDGGTLQVGIALYDDASSGVALGGSSALSFDDVVESGGHRWQLDDTTIAPVGAARLDTQVPTDRGPVLVSVLAGAALGTTVDVDFGGQGRTSVSMGGGGGTSEVVGVGGGTVTMEAKRPTGTLRLASATYVLAD